MSHSPWRQPYLLAVAPFRPQHASIPSRWRWIVLCNQLALPLAVTDYHVSLISKLWQIHRLHLVGTWTVDTILSGRSRLFLIPPTSADLVEQFLLLLECFDFAAQWVANSRIPTLPGPTVGWRPLASTVDFRFREGETVSCVFIKTTWDTLHELVSCNAVVP